MKLTGETEALILWKSRCEGTLKVPGPEQVQYHENHIKVLNINSFFSKFVKALTNVNDSSCLLLALEQRLKRSHI